MPIYEYRCDSCGHALDALQKLSDAPLAVCPQCDAAALRRLVSAPRFRLKGSGWYETDFKSDKETKRNLADSKGDAAAASEGQAKDSPGKEAKPTEAKPTEAKPTETKPKPSSDSSSGNAAA
jgi:putative FmdB family regulatory protein